MSRSNTDIRACRCIKEDIDHIVGILHVKDLLQAMRHPHQQVVLRDMLRPVHYVPDTARADDILRDLLRNRIHMAVVVDEYGGTSGMLDDRGCD